MNSINKRLKIRFHLRSILTILILLTVIFSIIYAKGYDDTEAVKTRDRISLNFGWKFYKYESGEKTDDLIYDERPFVRDDWNFGQADDEPTEADEMQSSQQVLKPWILPTGNDFIKDKSKRFKRPEGNPGIDFPFVKEDFDDSQWEEINLPHDWAIKGPFFEGPNPKVRGGMGRLPSPGVAWYRKKLEIPKSDEGRSIFLDVDGAMSYAMVWLNGYLVGGWPFGYNSWRVDLTPYVVPGGDNQLAIRVDNPNFSSRWYPGGGIYRNVWLVKTNSVHVAQWGTYITTENITPKSAKINLELTIENDSQKDIAVSTVTKIYEIDREGNQSKEVIAEIRLSDIKINSKSNTKVTGSVNIENPKLWGPPPTQMPNLYAAVSNLDYSGNQIDIYKTIFGIRSLRFDPNSGIFVNGELIKLQGVNQHHDLGALGAAFNIRAAERQLEILAEMGCNAIRMAHNPPAPELLDLTDRMGFLVMDESFDVWERKKTPHDFHLIFPEWYEQDMRSMLRRDRNHPSVIIWSFGNEVGEQYTDKDGAEVAKKLHDICKDEDPTRPTTASKNWAKPDMPFPNSMDLISLNYQGQGIRQDPFFEGVDRIRTKPMFGDFHKLHPDKVILGSETASTFSSRGIYYFPVVDDISSYTRDGRGGNSEEKHVSSYELYSVDFGASPDKVFRSLDTNLYVAGEFVWTGWDHLGEPTPYYDSRSSYCGIIDMAGFKKDRFYLYQSRWRPDYPMAHILPHWNWPERVGEITPIHVFTSGDEAELFINGNSQGKKKKGKLEYRLRWDDVVYEPGEVKVIAYKNGEKWAESIVRTTGAPAQLQLSADRSKITADGYDLSFVTVEVNDKEGLLVPTANNLIKFDIDGPGEIVATDNGDPTDFNPLPSKERNLFSGKALAIVRSIKDQEGEIKVSVSSGELKGASMIIRSEE